MVCWLETGPAIHSTLQGEMALDHEIELEIGFPSEVCEPTGLGK
jgi:hypothetical protein